jgi:sugar phosphate permease
MMNLFTEPAGRAKAMGVFGFVAAVAVVLLLPGFGAGMAPKPVLLAAMSDVAAKQSGFASGLVNTAFMMGGALGLAVLASLAASRSARLETAGDTHVAALTGGCHLAFLTCALVAATAATMAGLLPRTRNTAARSDTGPSALATTEGY